jgi:enoyl-CoA hydratase/carnithine racemase
MRKAVIGAINGAAVGSGSTMILSCDYRVAARDSRFGFVFTRRGICPEGGSAWYLPRLVGLGTAMDWMVSGRVVSAEEACAAGLVQELVDPENVIERATAYAQTLATMTSPAAVAVTRRMLLRLSGLPSPRPVHEIDSRLLAELISGEDAAEGVHSFLERRPANFELGLVKSLPPSFDQLPSGPASMVRGTEI